MQNVNFSNGDDHISVRSEHSATSKNTINTVVYRETCENIVRILVVDDELLVRNTIKRYFKKLNEDSTSIYKIEFFEAENCFNAMQLLYKSFTQNLLFNYVIIDEHMPFMKGSTLIKLMTQLYHENNFYKINFISYTSFDTSEKKKYILDQGADHILNKPINFDDFREFILTCFSKLS